MQYSRCGNLWMTSGSAYGIYNPRTDYDRVTLQEVCRCTREKGVPGNYARIVQDVYEGAITGVKSSVVVTEKIPVGIWLHQ